MLMRLMDRLVGLVERFALWSDECPKRVDMREDPARGG